MSGLTLYLNPQHNFIKPTNKVYFVSNLEIVKYFDWLVMCVDAGLEI